LPQTPEDIRDESAQDGLSPEGIDVRIVACALLSVAVAGCGLHRGPKVASDAQHAEEATQQIGRRRPEDSLETFIAKVRKLSAEARPERAPAATIEGSDPQLGAAVAAATLAPSAEHFRAAAVEYARVGINDRAYEYLRKAVTAAPRDAAGYDALARLWRDSGFPQLGLGDAYRAIHYAPMSPIAHNTLGTLLQALGHRQAARAQYEHALQLDPTAIYALTNLCYGWVLEGEGRRALAACQDALKIDPDFVPATNNLALAYAVSGRVDAARAAFDQSGNRARALYNIGIVHLARREYAHASRAFEARRQMEPTTRLAVARLRQIEDFVHPEAAE
jgi:Flp pilus assembly protein TadD